MKILTMKSLRINQKHDLVALAKKGEKDAFISLIQQNKVNLYRVAKAMLHNETDVEDAIQMTILKAYEKLGGLRKNKYFKTWLIRILINECNKAIKDRKQIAVLDYLHGNHLISEDTYENIDLQAAIHSLKAELRGVTVLFYYDDLTTKEIGKILNIPEGTVRSRLSTARGQLKKILKLEG